MIRTLAPVGLALVLASPLAGPLAIAETPSAQSLLEEMTEASGELDYQGRFLYQLGAEVSTMEVRHAVFDGLQYQRLTHLDGQLVEVLRTGDRVVCLHPDGTLTRIDDSGGPLLTLNDRLTSRIPEQYNVLVDGSGRVAGRAAIRMRVVPLDNHRYGYRLWVDEESRLLLKSEMVESGGMALERVEFVVLELEPDLDRDDFDLPQVPAEDNVSEADNETGYRVQAQWLPRGFRTAEQDWRRVTDRRHPMAAQSYSDGLATFTLFVERVETDELQEGVSRMGPTVAVSRHLSGEEHNYLITLVGEIPQATAERVMTSVKVETGD